MKNSHIADALESLLVSVPFYIRLHDGMDVYTADFVGTKFSTKFSSPLRASHARELR